MKKYLMTGLAAIAICAAFTSCSKNDELYNPEQITQNEAAQIQENYNKAFIATFGQPAANHDWGFGSKAMTRGYVDPNGNEWDDCPTVGPTERNDVFTYVNTLGPREKVIPADLSTYFVTHIYRGTDTHGSSNYPNSNMNQLEFAKSAPATITWDGNQQGDWFHVYDFNASISTDYEGNMRVVEIPPLNFAYYNSSDSKWHDKWIGVDGSEIGDDYKDYYYICFDFEAMPNEIYTIFEMPEANNAKVNVTGRYVGANNTAATGADLKAKGMTTVTDRFSGEEFTVQDNWKAVQIFNEHYYAPGNDNYTDWIIRLVKVQDDPDPEWDIRIIAEDLNATAQDTPAPEDGFDESDWDFNDVVFDVKFTSQTTANVKIVGAGGVLPLYVDGHEAHEALGQSGPDSKGYYRIQNSGNATPFEVTGIDRDNNGKDIVITVVRISSTGDPIISELTAPNGKPAAKIGVDPKFKPCAEREDIRERYPMFMNWVQTNFSGAWYDID